MIRAIRYPKARCFALIDVGPAKEALQTANKLPEAVSGRFQQLAHMGKSERRRSYVM